MTPHAMRSPRQELRRRSVRGIALVLVLGFLVLISALVIAMFTSSRIELAAADSYASGITTRQLSDMAVGIVQAQISDGTKSWEVPDNPATSTIDPGDPKRRLTWSSQPGLIRTYDDDGAPHRTFKLFSARNMVESAGTDYIPVRERKTEIKNDWPSRRAQYVDLNAPVLIDDSNGVITRGSRKFTAQYPILDPAAFGPVDGFKIDLGSSSDPLVPESVPGYGGSAKTAQALQGNFDPTAPAGGGDLTSNPVPMPVVWMYVLANGKVTVPDDTDDKDPNRVYWRTSLPDSVRPTVDNPIVGRIAFWTDDESCKLNINTASEGVYWDRPWANSDSTSLPFAEKQLARRIPAKHEYNRFPGHPASTCLSPVFAGLMPNSIYSVPTSDNWTKAQYSKFQSYYDLAPRVGYKGSMAGTVDTVTNGRDPDYSSIVLDQNRLYASIDELTFRSPDGPDSLGSGGNVRLGNAGFTRTVLERAKFFLTTSSRAPDLNAFSQPRVSLWPLQVDPDPNKGKGGCPATVRNAKDKLIATCSTVGSGSNARPFYFQRASIYLREQVNNRVVHRTQPFAQLTPAYFPPSSQQPVLDWTQVQRNRELYSYLQRLTDQKIPGFGRSLGAKYQTKMPAKYLSDPNGHVPTERDQILTEMIDLARSGVNTYSTDSQLPPRYEYAPARDMPDASIGETQLVPLVPPAVDSIAGGTKGFGRFPTVTEGALQFFRTDYKPQGVATAQDCIRAVFIPEFASPTCGPASWSPLIRVRVLNLDKLLINNVSQRFLPSPVSLITSRAGYGSGSNHSTAFNGLFMNFRIWNGAGSDMNKKFPSIDEIKAGTYKEEESYPFISREILVPTGTTTFSFSAPEDVIVEVYAGYAAAVSADTLVQRIHLSFPPGTWSLPKAGDKDINHRIDPGASNDVGKLVDVNNDIVRSVELNPAGPSGGDLRLLSGLREVPSTFFAPYDGTGSDGVGYTNTSTPMVHSLRLGGGTVWGGRNTSRLITGGPTSPSPVGARNMKAALNRDGKPGDWDNGNGNLEDGAYINKPDEGNAATGDGGYFASGSFVTEKSDTFSPNRQVTSAVMFGSLPTGLFSDRPWQTLLFCPNPACASSGYLDTSHPGRQPGQARDHHFLDLFTMPIVEPYAISEPCSTAGRVNLNYQIAPFTYIHRSTALRGVLKSTRVTAFPTAATNYKSGAGGISFRQPIKMDETMRFFEERFAKTSTNKLFQGDTGPFRAASEICDMPLVPLNGNYQSIKDGSYWRGNQLTGDNARETPYAQIYPRVTTKSNVFTVHVRVQMLRKAKPMPGTGASDREKAACEWTEGKDQVLGEYRGSSTVERYIDPADQNLPDFALPKNGDASMDEFYRFRAISTKRFTP